MIDIALNFTGTAIIRGDTLRVPRGFPDAVFGGIVTDPPYAGGAADRNARQKSTAQKYFGAKTNNLVFHIVELNDRRSAPAKLVSPDELLSDLNRTYMEKAKEPQTNMLRVAQDAADWILRTAASSAFSVTTLTESINGRNAARRISFGTRCAMPNVKSRIKPKNRSIRPMVNVKFTRYKPPNTPRGMESSVRGAFLF